MYLNLQKPKTYGDVVHDSRLSPIKYFVFTDTISQVKSSGLGPRNDKVLSYAFKPYLHVSRLKLPRWNSL